MKSTGEVMGIGKSFAEAYAKGMEGRRSAKSRPRVLLS